jgi:hypothetical protein
MIRSRIGRVVRVTIPVVLLVVVTSVVTLSAQGNPTLNQILAQLDAIIGMLTPTPPADVTLSTSALLVPATQQVRCMAVNLGTEAVEVSISLLDEDGVVQAGGSGTLPHKHLGNVVQAGPGFRRCEFRFFGTAQSVRANLIARNIGDGVVTVNVEAR